MRQSGKNTRQRGRGGRRNNNFGQINRNTTLDSNGPDVRLRGNAQQLHEKYTSLANESSAAGERIMAEAYYQYADHYFRVHSTIVANTEDRRQSQPPSQSQSSDADTGSGDTPAANGKPDAAETPSAQAIELASEAETPLTDDNAGKDKDQPSSMVS
jgi:hypothetical protein